MTRQLAEHSTVVITLRVMVPHAEREDYDNFTASEHWVLAMKHLIP
jgi:hypothetical protein